MDRRVALRAWPLVQISHPEVTREAWLSYAVAAGRRLGKNRGLIAIEDSRGYIHAIFGWHVVRSVSHRRAMRVTDMVVGALPGRRLAESVVSAIREMADQVQADSVLIEIGDRQLAPGALLSDGFEQFALHCLRIERTPESVN